MNSPIVLFCYNRIDCLKKTVEALKSNELASESDLFVFSDGPKTVEDSAAVSGVRAFLKTISGFRSVSVKEAETNRGLASSVIAGVSEIVNRFGRVIVLEDDLVTSPAFLRFMNQALDLYENEESVAGIQAWSPSGFGEKPDLYFTREVGCWGWATWKRGWDLFEEDSSKLLAQFKTAKQKYEFNIYNSYPYYRMLRNQNAGLVDSWAIRWYASVFLKGKLGLQSGRNLIENIGYSSGTHFDESSNITRDVICKDVPAVQKIKPVFSEEILRKIYVPYFKKNSGIFLPDFIFFLKNLAVRCLPHGLFLYLKNKYHRRRGKDNGS